MNKTQKFFPKNVEKMYEKGNFNKFFEEVSIPKKIEDFKNQPIENVIHEIDLQPIVETQEEPLHPNTASVPDSDLLDEADDIVIKSPFPQYVPIEKEKSKKPIVLLIGVLLGIIGLGAGVWMFKAEKPTSEIVIPMVAGDNDNHVLPDVSTIHLPLQKAEIIPQPESVKEPQEPQEENEVKINEPAVIIEPSLSEPEIEQNKNIEQAKPLSEAQHLKNEDKESEKTNLDKNVVKPTPAAPVNPVLEKSTQVPKPPAKKVKKETPKKDIWELEADKKLQELNDTLK